jgi:hypothetical protein
MYGWFGDDWFRPFVVGTALLAGAEQLKPPPDKGHWHIHQIPIEISCNYYPTMPTTVSGVALPFGRLG